MKVYLPNMVSGSKLPPMRTLKEMADEFGISPRQLCGYLAKHPYAGHKLRSGTANITNKMWYDPQSLRAWWAATKPITISNVRNRSTSC